MTCISDSNDNDARACAGAVSAKWYIFKTSDDWGAASAAPVSTAVVPVTLTLPATASAFSRVEIWKGTPGLSTKMPCDAGFFVLPLSQYGFLLTLALDSTLFTGIVVLPNGQRQTLEFDVVMNGSAVVAQFCPTVVSTAYQVLVRHATQGLLSVDAAFFSTTPPGIFSVAGPMVTNDSSIVGCPGNIRFYCVDIYIL